ncbi:ATP-dependent helicase, partial [Vibrio sp. 10N.222.49.C9]
ECTDLEFSVIKDSKGKNFLRVVYLGESGNKVGLNFYLNTPAQKKSFYSQFVKLHLADKHQEFDGLSPTKVVNQQHRFRLPKFVIARKEGRFWKLRDVIFDNEFML